MRMFQRSKEDREGGKREGGREKGSEGMRDGELKRNGSLISGNISFVDMSISIRMAE